MGEHLNSYPTSNPLSGGEVSERLRWHRDEEISNLLEKAELEADKLISEHQKELELLAKELLEREDISKILSQTNKSKRV